MSKRGGSSIQNQREPVPGSGTHAVSYRFPVGAAVTRDDIAQFRFEQQREQVLRFARDRYPDLFDIYEEKWRDILASPDQHTVDAYETRLQDIEDFKHFLEESPRPLVKDWSDLYREETTLTEEHPFYTAVAQRTYGDIKYVEVDAETGEEIDGVLIPDEPADDPADDTPLSGPPPSKQGTRRVRRDTENGLSKTFKGVIGVSLVAVFYGMAADVAPGVTEPIDQTVAAATPEVVGDAANNGKIIAGLSYGEEQVIAGNVTREEMDVEGGDFTDELSAYTDLEVENPPMYALALDSGEIIFFPEEGLVRAGYTAEELEEVEGMIEPGEDHVVIPVQRMERVEWPMPWKTEPFNADIFGREHAVYRAAGAPDVADRDVRFPPPVPVAEDDDADRRSALKHLHTSTPSNASAADVSWTEEDVWWLPWERTDSYPPDWVERKTFNVTVDYDQQGKCEEKEEDRDSGYVFRNGTTGFAFFESMYGDGTGWPEQQQREELDDRISHGDRVEVVVDADPVYEDGEREGYGVLKVVWHGDYQDTAVHTDQYSCAMLQDE